MVERLVIMAPRDVIGPEDLPPPLRPRDAAPTGDGRAARRDAQGGARGFERAYILGELRAHDWNMTRTAERLGIERSHLYRKLRPTGSLLPSSRAILEGLATGLPISGAA